MNSNRTAPPMVGVYGHVLPFNGIMPRIAEGVFIAPGAVVVGDVEIGPGSSVWYNAVIRGDVNRITIGRSTNIQDCSVIHVSARDGVVIGDDVLVGHLCMLHGCTLQDGCFIGMKSTILDAAMVETGAMVAAAALVSPRKVVTAGKLWAGSPAVPMRDLSPEEIARFKVATDGYAGHAGAHAASLAVAAE